MWKEKNKVEKITIDTLIKELNVCKKYLGNAEIKSLICKNNWIKLNLIPEDNIKGEIENEN